MKVRAKKIAKTIWKTDEKALSKAYNHLAICSCHMCGNPRRYFNEKTISEKKNEEKFKDDLFHFENCDYYYDEMDELSNWEIEELWEKENEKAD